ncbi:MAG: isoprenyl transferase [Chthoniobacterales bacterium]|nr:isoprenyl transferase [Chthoniobacterales bacterium]
MQLAGAALNAGLVESATMRVPRHVAVIMDGNGRWAAQRSLPRVAGHEAGSRAVGEVVHAAIEAGVEFLTLYAFSAENWKRPRAEVDSLMRLLARFLDERTGEILEKNVCLKAIGRVWELPEQPRERLERAIRMSAGNNGLTVILALNYSGRNEITDAVREIARKVRDREMEPEEITPDVIAAHLDTREWPDPDLLIRTSGEMRVSNFLLWQLSYTELYISPKLWPDFTREDFLDALRDYARRERRFGGV